MIGVMTQRDDSYFRHPNIKHSTVPVAMIVRVVRLTRNVVSLG